MLEFYIYDGLGRLPNQTVTVGKPVLSAYGYVLSGHGTGSTLHLVEAIAQMALTRAISTMTTEISLSSAMA